MISVCIATYNGEKYIKEQILSILSQIEKDDEIIISDDNSQDKTILEIESVKDHRIKIYKNEYRLGYTRNFENALKKSLGDIIFLSDQDDIWIQGKVSKCLSYLKYYDFVVSDNIVTNDELKTIHKSHFEYFNTKSGFLNNLLFPRYVGACMAFKRDILVKSLPFPKKTDLAAHDYWICLVAEAYFKTKLIKTPLILYRRHSNNASTGGKRSKNSILHKILVRIYILFNLIKAFFR